MPVLSCCEHRMYNPKASPTTAGEGTWRTHSHSQQKMGLPSRVPQSVSSNQRSSLLRLPLLRWRHVSNSRVFAAFVDTLVYCLLCVRPVVLQRWSLMPPKQQLSSHPQSMLMPVVTRSKTMLRPRIG